MKQLINLYCPEVVKIRSSSNMHYIINTCYRQYKNYPKTAETAKTADALKPFFES